MPDPALPHTLTAVAVLTIYAASAVRDRFASDDPIEEAVDDDHEAIRLVVKDVNRVRPATSKAIAREFENLNALRRADRERLEGVPGVGAELAEAVLNRVREE